MPISRGWSRPQVVLHWLTVALVIVQLILGSGMSQAWEAREEAGAGFGAAPIVAWLHVLVGASILLIMLYRLYLRRTHGHPPSPEGEPQWAATLGALTHGLLYFLLIAMSLTGATAWFLGLEPAAMAHAGPIRIALIAAVLVHAAGALVEHFVLKTPVLKRMLRPET